MYAIVKTGGKQYTVKSGDIIRVEKLAGDAGDKVVLSDILMLGGSSPVAGTPLVADALVNAEVVEQFRDDKVLIFKKKRRHNYRRKKGHRQYLTALRITSIALNGKTLSEAPAVAKKAKPAPKTAQNELALDDAGNKPAAKKAAAPKAKAPAKPKAEAKPAAKKPAAKAKKDEA